MTVEGIQQIVVPTEKDVVSIALTDGELLWRITFPAERRSNNSATPIVDGQTVIFTGQGRGAKAFRIEKHGDKFTTQELWHKDELGTGFNTPVLRDGLLFGLDGRGSFFCMVAQTGQIAWTDTARQGRFGAILDAGSVILALPSNSELIAYRPSGTGYEELARYSVSDTPIYAHPVIAGNRVFVKDQETIALWMIE
jgi:outer membrane protein assembly factor BamB